MVSPDSHSLKTDDWWAVRPWPLGKRLHYFTFPGFIQ